MNNVTNMDENFTMMEHAIKVLKKSIEDKDLQFA